MANEPPPLALSDIMHPFTPSPSQEEDSGDHGSRSQFATPEPLDEAQIEAIKSRVSELSASEIPSLSSREQELLDMVLRLSNSIRLDPSQLVAQAQTIYQLTQQRDILTREFEEERLRWDAERLGWSRMAEALIFKRRTSTSFQQEDMDRYVASVQADNRSLRQRLSDAQSRLATVEAELMQLQPLLMLQPFPLSAYPANAGMQQFVQITGVKEPMRRSHRKKDLRKGKEIFEEVPISEDEVNELADDEEGAATPKQKARTTRVVKSSKGKSRAQNNKLTSLMADARAEHMLLAARKLGRERVAYVSGMFAQQPDEYNTERGELPSTTIPRTPKRNSAQIYPHFQPRTQPQAYVYLNSPTKPSPGLPVWLPVAPSAWPVPRTPMSPVKLTQRGSSTNNAHATPLDSLVSAARSILDDDQSPSKLPGKRERAKRVPEEFDSPVPKRRRVSSGGQDSSRKDSANIDRVRSALDVLADQAAVFSSQEKEKEDSAESSGHELTPNGGENRTDKKRAGRRRSTRLQQSLVDQQGELKDPDSNLVRHSYSPDDVPPSRSTSRTPPMQSDAMPASLAHIDEIDPSARTHFLHREGLTAFMSPRSGSPEIVHYRNISSPIAFAARVHSSPHIHAGVYTTASSEVNSSPGYPFRYGHATGAPNTDSASQRGGARMSMNLSSAGTIPAKRKRADDKRAKTPYKKWSKDEDEVLAQAVAKYGQKWDQVQKALPERGYHQVRQRWLRRLRSNDHSRMADSGTGASVALNGNDRDDGAITPNPKLGMAPLSSEIAVAAVSGFSIPPIAEGSGQPVPTTDDPP